MASKKVKAHQKAYNVPKYIRADNKKNRSKGD
jgi:hypothetical protein